MSRWEVIFSQQARKHYEKLKRSGQKKPSIIDLLDFLAIELQEKGAQRADWPNYSKLSKNISLPFKKRPPYLCGMLESDR